MTVTAGVNADITLEVAGKYIAVNDLASVEAEIDVAGIVRLVQGVSAGQADKIFTDTRSVAGSTVDSVDLYGALNDPFGKTLNFATIKGIIIKAAAANGAGLRIGGAAANPVQLFFNNTNNKITLGAGGIFCLVQPGAGWAVTTATADILAIENLDTASASYDIIIIGTSA